MFSVIYTASMHDSILFKTYQCFICIQEETNFSMSFRKAGQQRFILGRYIWKKPKIICVVYVCNIGDIACFFSF